MRFIEHSLDEGIRVRWAADPPQWPGYSQRIELFARPTLCGYFIERARGRQFERAQERSSRSLPGKAACFAGGRCPVPFPPCVPGRDPGGSLSFGPGRRGSLPAVRFNALGCAASGGCRDRCADPGRLLPTHHRDSPGLCSALLQAGYAASSLRPLGLFPVLPYFLDSPGVPLSFERIEARTNEHVVVERKQRSSTTEHAAEPFHRV